MAGRPGSGGVAHRTPVDLPSKRLRLAPLVGVSVAAALLALWLIADPRTPDLAAQVYRVGLFRHLGFAVWDEHWYAGHHLPGYSLLFPPLASLLGLRLVAALSVLASAALFERLALAIYGPSARWGAAWFAVAAVGDVWIGRLAFALGVSLALAAVLALVRGRSFSAGVFAALCAAASPVAGVLLALAGLTHAFASRSPRAVLVLAAPAAAVVVPQALLFPEGGFEPYPALSFAATVLVVVAFLWALPPAQRLLRVGALVYLLACVLCLLVHTPMGSNIERYGVLLAGPLLLCALLGAPGRRRVRAARGRRGRSASVERFAAADAGGCGRACYRGLGGVGTGARDARSGRERIDERLLLRAGRALPDRARRAAGARRGAAHALALGGGAARADGLARARLGEAAGHPFRSRPARARADRGRL